MLRFAAKAAASESATTTLNDVAHEPTPLTTDVAVTGEAELAGSLVRVVDARLSLPVLLMRLRRFTRIRRPRTRWRATLLRGRSRAARCGSARRRRFVD